MSRVLFAHSRVAFRIPDELPSVETPPQLRTTKAEAFTIDVPSGARIEHGTGGDDPLLTARWSEAVVRVIAHREIGVMTVRDYGVDMMSVVHASEPHVHIDHVEYGTLAGIDCAVVRGTADAFAVVAMCAALGANRVVVLGSVPIDDDHLADQVDVVLGSLRMA